MLPASFAIRDNLDVIDSSYARWRADPRSVDSTWRLFFAGFDFRASPGLNGAAVASHPGILRLIDRYRRLGHRLAHLDPLSQPPHDLPELELAEFNLSNREQERVFDAGYFHGLKKAKLADIIAALKDTYCRTIGVEYLHVQDTRARDWLQQRMEPCHNRPTLARPARLRILRFLRLAELFEEFLQTSYVGQKRFSLEGAETLIPVLDALVEKAAGNGVQEIVMGMSHRGRLNVLANLLGKPYGEIFSEFEENYVPLSSCGDGDVKYHLGFSSDRDSTSGRRIHLSLTPNPSHVEAVNPVVEGRTRAKQEHFGDSERTRGMAVLIHGDAAVAGQGIVAETLNLSQLDGFTTGGTLHVVVNNQIGFTTAPGDARSTAYCTDVAKMIEAPIFHVNAEDPEAAVFVGELAFDFRQAFHRDVFVDLVCYRRHGHNESDDPSYTQPIMVARIKDRPKLAQVYTEQLIAAGVLTADESGALDDEFQGRLQAARDEVKARQAETEHRAPAPRSGPWTKLAATYERQDVDTGVPADTLQHIVKGVTHLPDGFHVHPRLERALAKRWQDVQAGQPIDWSLAESLAFGSLLREGTPVRLSGQDSRRGTFSQRHDVLVDMQSAQEYCPLNALAEQQALFTAIDSPLSENAVLGFEFGYSLDAPETLVLWEAQFGDFANGAQVIIDQFLVCCQSKWQRDSGLVLLLPHGYEGQGPEHSSARLERFLQMCAEDNIQVCNPSTPAQYFHVLRRQMRRSFRKPLVIMTPKSLLRHQRARSPIDELAGGRFQEVLDDATAAADRVRRVLLCSGKIFYELSDQRDQRHAVIRIEQFYPFEEDMLARVLRRYRKARELVWVQEEPQNMGGWSFMAPRLRSLGFEPTYVGRAASASAAVGSHHLHGEEQQAIVAAAMEATGPQQRRPRKKRGGT